MTETEARRFAEHWLEAHGVPTVLRDHGFEWASHDGELWNKLFPFASNPETHTFEATLYSDQYANRMPTEPQLFGRIMFGSIAWAKGPKKLEDALRYEFDGVTVDLLEYMRGKHLI